LKKKALLPIAFTSRFLFSEVAGAKFVNLTEANPFHHAWICEGDVSPSRSTEPPTFLPLSPENDTVHAVDTISLSSSLNAGNSSTASSRVLDEIYCETDWQPTGVSETICLTIKKA